MRADAVTKISYARDIRPLFRDLDIKSMIKVRNLDLSSYDQVSAEADGILERLEAGDMPCDGAWPAKDVESFRQWISDGKLP
jgi:hypothetical protein